MQTLDTNVLVRVLVGDDPDQTALAEQAFLDAIACGGVFVPDVVLAEVAWVLPVRTFDQRFAQTKGVQLLTAPSS